MSVATISHVTLPVPHLEAADAYYGALLRFLGYRKQVHVADMRAWECSGNGCSVALWRSAAGARSGGYVAGVRHLGFSVASRTMVDQCYELMGGLNGRIVHPPDEYDTPRCYALFCESPEGTLVEVVHQLMTLDETGHANSRLS